MTDQAITAPALVLHGKPGGISWQARLLNGLFRHLVKRPVRKAGTSPRAMRSVVRLLEWVSPRRGMGGPLKATAIAGVPCDVIGPQHPRAEERVVLYLHGGGFFAHLPRSYRRFGRRLAQNFGATVVLPAYRLAPEHRYPAASDDCLAVYRKLLDRGHDPASICLMGDSAGGNLALVTLLRARDAQLPLPACAILLSPGADLTFAGASYRGNADADPFIPVQALGQLVEQYVDADQVSHPYVSPMLGDFTGLPPLQILVGSTEVLLDSSISTAESSRTDGVDVVLQVWRDMPHVFPIFGYLPEAHLAMQTMAGFFDHHTTKGAKPPPGDK